MKLKRWWLFAAVSLFCLTGCQEKNMSDKFKDSAPVILTDEQGNRYVAEHHIGNTYTLKPLPPLDKMK